EDKDQVAGHLGETANERESTPMKPKNPAGDLDHNQRASAFELVPPLSIFAPAKLNLFLAVTGRRADGFHDLVSVVAPLDFGDTLRVEPAVEGFSLTCDDPELAVDETNLVLKSARAFAHASGWTGGARF